MRSPDPHPDDATLFDLTENRLDEDAARRVERHLETCAECAELVRSSLAGSPDELDPTITMPAAQVRHLTFALAGAWQELRANAPVLNLAAEPAADTMAGTTTVPGAEPAAPTAAPPTAAIAAADELTSAPIPSIAPAIPRPPRRRPRRTARDRPDSRRRWLVPALAMAVLAVLAGTSITADRTDQRSSSPASPSAQQPAADDDAARSSNDSDESSNGAEASEDADGGSSDAATEFDDDVGDSGIDGDGGIDDATGSAGAAASESGDASLSLPDAPAPASGTDPGRSLDATAPSSASGAPDASREATEESDDKDAELVDITPRACIATQDPSMLTLPDGRPPTQIVVGPFDVYVACG